MKDLRKISHERVEAAVAAATTRTKIEGIVYCVLGICHLFSKQR